MKTVLVTGAHGYLGKQFVKSVPSKYEVLTLSRRNLSSKKHIRADISKDNLDIILPKKIDTIVHIAGLTGAKNPKDFFKVNTHGTMKLVDVAKKRKVKKFVYVSSMAVTNSVLIEYGLSKLKAEEYIRKSGLRYLIFRPSMIFSKDSPAIKSIFNKISSLPLFTFIIGDGTNCVAPIHVKDVSSALVKSLDDEVLNRTYSLVGRRIDLNSFFEDILEMYGKKRKIIHVPKFLALFGVKFLSLFIPSFKGLLPLVISMTDSTKRDFLPEYYEFDPIPFSAKLI